MTREELLNHYRTLYQVVKRDKDELERELEEFKTLSTMQQDIIVSLNKRLEKLKLNNDVLENRLNETLKNIKISKNSITKFRTIRVK